MAFPGWKFRDWPLRKTTSVDRGHSTMLLMGMCISTPVDAKEDSSSLFDDEYSVPAWTIHSCSSFSTCFLSFIHCLRLALFMFPASVAGMNSAGMPYPCSLHRISRGLPRCIRIRVLYCFSCRTKLETIWNRELRGRHMWIAVIRIGMTPPTTALISVRSLRNLRFFITLLLLLYCMCAKLGKMTAIAPLRWVSMLLMSLLAMSEPPERTNHR
mmetsp:Transcript_6390/g.12786  ORF Transcript_6390/g.12786 Transcript_6390/m.12786 type:complete len:213 (+) Transcript_6390:735-1373(+)